MRRLFLVSSLLLAVLCGCQAAGSLFNPDEAGHTQAGDTLVQTGQSTGSPWLVAAGTVVNLLAAAFLSKKAAAAKDAEPANVDDAQSMAAALRAAGYKVERV